MDNMNGFCRVLKLIYSAVYHMGKLYELLQYFIPSKNQDAKNSHEQQETLHSDAKLTGERLNDESENQEAASFKDLDKDCLMCKIVSTVTLLSIGTYVYTIPKHDEKRFLNKHMSTRGVMANKVFCYTLGSVFYIAAIRALLGATPIIPVPEDVMKNIPTLEDLWKRWNK